MAVKKFITDTNLQRFGTNVKSAVSAVKTTADNALTIANSKLSSVKSINGTSMVGTGNLTLADIGIDGDICVIVSELPAASSAKSNKLYLVPVTSSTDNTNTYAEYVVITKNNTATWEKLGEWKADITVDTAISSTSTNPVQNKVISAALGNKVDVVSGKGLSTNDYTADDKTKLDTIVSKDITLSQIDTCGYGTIAALMSAVIAAKREFVFNITDIGAKLLVYADTMSHALYQRIETSNILDSNYALSSSHKDGIIYVYYRAYLNTPSSLYANNTGYTSSSKEWSPWIIADTLGVANKAKAGGYNQVMSYYGRMFYATISKNGASTKLTFNTSHIGGTGKDAYSAVETEIPEATTTCNGLLSTTDKAKVDALGDDFSGFEELSDDDINTLWSNA